MKKNNNNRAIELFNAACKGRVELLAIQREISQEIIGNELIANDETCRSSRALEYSDLSDFEATVELAVALAMRLNDKPSRYDLRVCDKSMFRALWSARQTIDMTGIPYPTYISEAVQWLQQAGKKRIRPSMLTSSEVLLHVMERYEAEILVWRRGNAELDGVVDPNSASSTEA